MGTLETQQKLQQWGMWQRGSLGLGYGNVLGRIHGGGVRLPNISDDEALGIDRVMGILKRFNFEQYRCVELAYVDEKSNRAIAREIGIPPRTVQLRIEKAEGWIGLQLGTHEKVVAGLPMNR